jgi:hypothetical protein
VQQIKGYASATSVGQNENITFYVSVNPAQNFTIDFYRFGYYGGLGARLRQHVGPIAGVQQPACPMDATTGKIECNWTAGYVLTVPADWTSGVYGAMLTNDQGFQNFVIFVVRDGRPAPFLYQQSASTDQAYNNYPNDGATGKSVYGFNSYGANTVSGTTAAVKVSFDRPYADSGMGQFYRWEMDFIRWLEKSGYDVTYSTSIDTHANGAALLSHKAFLSVGHDEYWSKEMRDAVELARDSGVSLAFFGANASYTQVRFESSSSGVANRVVVEYRDLPWAHTDPVQGPTTTGDFRWLGRPEQTMIGVQFSFTSPNIDYVVTNSSHWVYAGTTFRDGDHVAGIVGYEADSLMSNQPPPKRNYPPPNTTNQTLLSASPYADSSGSYTANSSIYQAPSGAWVFGAGTLSFAWALEDAPGVLRQFKVDARVQKMTTNILNAFLNGAPPTPTITGFTPASGPSGTSVTISGTNFTGATAVAFNGTAATFTVTSSSAIQATVPAGATSGPISVATPGGTVTSTSSYSVAPPPTIASFSPASGLAGASVTISGANFTGAAAVTFNGTAATFSVTSDAAIQATVPAGATTGPLGVTTPGGTATSGSSFTVLVAPTITSVTPANGPAGTVVTIGGTNFTGVTAVAFNGTAAAIYTVTSATAIQATAPAGVTTGPLSVTTAGGTATSAAAFTAAPTIASVTPASGPVGTVVTISGANFTGATSVRFNGVSATTFTVMSATAIQAAVPAGATTGPLSVTAPGGTATSAGSFTVAPAITSFTPASGPAGTVVTITGTNFTGATAVGFNGSAASFTVNSATTIQATVPAGATTGPVSVTTSGGSTTSASNFTVTVQLTVSKTHGLLGLSDGMVTSSPGGITCGTSCSASYNMGTVVILTARPNLLALFGGWSGDQCDSVSSNGTVCTVTMSRAKTVVASFVP